jgi:hypothetical protein
MKTLIRLTLLSFLMTTCVGVASADRPGDHPAYIHALSDLRDARAHLDYLASNERRDAEEQHAIQTIDDAINEIKRAAIDDGKNINDHMPVDARSMRGDRYRKALELLGAAHRDVTGEEDNPRTRGLQARVIGHIDEAHRIVEHLAGNASGGGGGRHPNYIHALSDLRDARGHLDQLAANEQRDAEEQHAIQRIDDAINEIKRASIDDGKDIQEHMPIDARLRRGERFRKALELLDAAHRDCTMEEDDPQTQGLQGRIIAHIDEAHRIVERLQARYNH